MEIIEIKKYNEIEGMVYGYCAEPNIESAVQQFTERFGTQPQKGWIKQLPSGRCTVYLQIPPHEINNHHTITNTI